MHFSRFGRGIGARVRRAAAAFALFALGLALAGGWASGAPRGAADPWAENLLRGENLLRLHVVAHSDAPRDQEVKLKVRDALLSEMAAWGPFSSRAQAEAWVKVNEERLMQVAREALLSEGFDLPVRIEAGEFHFPEKRAGGLILPAGEYRAVKVVIGDGAGRNWWCVLFPPLCFVEEEDERGIVEAAPAEPLPAAFAAGIPGLEPAAAEGSGPEGIAAEGPGPEASEGGEDGAFPGASPQVRWRLRLWEKLSQTAYAARLREMMELAWRSLRDEAL